MISFIIPFRSDGTEERERSFKYVHEALEINWPTSEIIVADSPQQEFNRSEARNIGADKARGDYLVFTDADSLVPFSQIEGALHAAFGSWSFPYDRYYSLSKAGTAQFYFGVKEPEYDYVFPGPDPIDRPASVGGCIVVSRRSFEEVHGYDERFIGWGFEDRAFALALETLVAREFRVPGFLYHLWHPEPEEQRFGQPYLEQNRTLHDRYVNSRGWPEMMRALVADH